MPVAAQCTKTLPLPSSSDCCCCCCCCSRATLLLLPLLALSLWLRLLLPPALVLLLLVSGDVRGLTLRTSNTKSVYIGVRRNVIHIRLSTCSDNCQGRGRTRLTKKFVNTAWRTPHTLSPFSVRRAHTTSNTLTRKKPEITILSRVRLSAMHLSYEHS